MIGVKNTDISDEFVLQRFAGGIKFVRPEIAERETLMPTPSNINVKKLFELPFNFYFNNVHSAIFSLNENCVKSTGLCSIKDAVGKTPVDFFCVETAYSHINNQQSIIQTKNYKILEEDVFRKNDEQYLNLMSIVYPLFSSDELLIGILGCSIIVGEQKISDFMSQLSYLGFLNKTTTQDKHKILPHLSQRENQCLRLMLKGYKTKEIALKLNLSIRTVESYIHNLKIKLNVTSKAELIVKVMTQINSAKTCLTDVMPI